MKKIQSTRFGELEIQEADLIKFPAGIPAFESEKEFVAVPYDESGTYIFLQSVQTPELAFLTTNPFLFFGDYSFELDDANLESLGIGGLEDMIVCSLLTVPASGIADMTANLLAPVVINKHTRVAKQVVLEGSQYTTRHRLFSPSKEEK